MHLIKVNTLTKSTFDKRKISDTDKECIAFDYLHMIIIIDYDKSASDY